MGDVEVHIPLLTYYHANMHGTATPVDGHAMPWPEEDKIRWLPLRLGLGSWLSLGRHFVGCSLLVHYFRTSHMRLEWREGEWEFWLVVVVDWVAVN